MALASANSECISLVLRVPFFHTLEQMIPVVPLWDNNKAATVVLIFNFVSLKFKCILYSSFLTCSKFSSLLENRGYHSRDWGDASSTLLDNWLWMYYFNCLPSRKVVRVINHAYAICVILHAIKFLICCADFWASILSGIWQKWGGMPG